MDRPNIKIGWWEQFPARWDGKDVDESIVAARFEQKHGYPPEYIVEEKGKLWVGPVRDDALD